MLAAAAAEIGGCYLVYGVLRLGLTPLWLVPAFVLLVGFAAALATIDTGGAGRTFAVYGGLYILSSMIWLAVVEQVALTRTDLIGCGLALTGAAVILAGARA